MKKTKIPSEISGIVQKLYNLNHTNWVQTEPNLGYEEFESDCSVTYRYEVKDNYTITLHRKASWGKPTPGSFYDHRNLIGHTYTLQFKKENRNITSYSGNHIQELFSYVMSKRANQYYSDVKKREDKEKNKKLNQEKEKKKELLRKNKENKKMLRALEQLL